MLIKGMTNEALRPLKLVATQEEARFIYSRRDAGYFISNI